MSARLGPMPELAPRKSLIEALIADLRVYRLMGEPLPPRALALAAISRFGEIPAEMAGKLLDEVYAAAEVAS